MTGGNEGIVSSVEAGRTLLISTPTTGPDFCSEQSQTGDRIDT